MAINSTTEGSFAKLFGGGDEDDVETYVLRVPKGGSDAQARLTCTACEGEARGTDPARVPHAPDCPHHG